MDRQGTRWEFEYVPNRLDTLLQSLKVDGGNLGQASVQYGQEHPDTPSGSHPNPPNAATHLQIGSYSALTWRFDYTYNRQPYNDVSANGLLTAFTEPARSGWWQLRYWGENSAYPNKTRWGNTASDWRYAYNQLWWVGGSHPHPLGSYNR